jgi:hypothetical protein
MADFEKAGKYKKWHFSGQFRRQKCLGPLEISLEMPHYVIGLLKNNIPYFQNPQNINS